MARGRTGEQRTNSLNGLAAPANNATDVSSSKLHLKNRGSTAWNFRQYHVVRKFDQLANDELEELSHAPERLITDPPSHNSHSATGNTNEHEFRLSQIPALWRIGFPQQASIAGCDPRERTALNKCTDANWRPQPEAPEGMTVPGPIAARFALFWPPVPQSLLLSYSS
jgi:hypothetical protein